jgi:dolichyl-phosphate beta-glucosyltransferase
MHPAPSPLVSVVVPAFNEAPRLGRSLRTIASYLNFYTSRSELIVVDDGSSDDTATVAERSLLKAGTVCVRIIRSGRNRGKGHAVRAGLLAARAPIALFTDADLSTPVTEVPTLLDPIARGERDLTFGSRALDRTLIGVHQPWLRETGGRVFNLCARAITGLPFWDTQCGFKAFRMDVCRPILEASTVDRFGFDVELLFVAHRAGLRLQEIPVRWDHCEGSTVNVGRDSLRMLDEIRRIRLQSAAGAYDQAIAAVQTTGSREQHEWAVRSLVPKTIG